MAVLALPSGTTPQETLNKLGSDADGLIRGKKVRHETIEAARSLKPLIENLNG